MIGPPGSGKTNAGEALPGDIAALTFQEAVETTQIHSVAGTLPKGVGFLSVRPFRAPHHTVSDAGLLGGGSGIPRPGEVSLAHHGVLFLDELPEFARNVLELLRQPLEERAVSLARSAMTLTFPASFLLIGALNPCPCGFFGEVRRSAAAQGDHPALSGEVERAAAGPHRAACTLKSRQCRIKVARQGRGSHFGSDARTVVRGARIAARARVLQRSHTGRGAAQVVWELDAAGERTLRNGGAADGVERSRARVVS